MGRPLVIAAHGTGSGAGRTALDALRDAVAREWPGPVTLGFVDVCGPSLADVLADLPVGGSRGQNTPERHPVRQGLVPALPPIVVPLFLASGVHVDDDVAAAVAGSHPAAVVTPPLGTLAPRFALVGAGSGPADEGDDPPPGALALVAAGSSRAVARTDIDDLARRLTGAHGAPVLAAYLTGAGPRLADLVRAHPAHRIRVVTHLLAPGHFADRLERVCRDLGLAAPAPPLLSRALREVARAVVDLAVHAAAHRH